MTTPAPHPDAPECGHASCAESALVHWTRRLTATELAAIPAEQHNADMQVMVFACGRHAITLELAAHIHASGCSGPNSPGLPTCDCTPEVHPAAPEAFTTLPTGWQIRP